MLNAMHKICLNAVLISLVMTSAIVQSAYAALKARDVKEANRLYEEGDFAASLEKFQQALEKEPESAIINFNTGTAYYKNQKYGQAINALHKSLLTEDESLQEMAYYNLGNSFYRAGIAREEEDIEMAIASLEKALVQYEGALKIDQKEDTEFNYEFVKKELERLKEKEQQQEQQQQQNQQQQSQDSQQQQNQDQQNQSSDSDDQQEQQNNPDQQNQQDQQQPQEDNQQDQQQPQDSSGNQQEQEQQNNQQEQAQNEAHQGNQEQQQGATQQMMNAQDLTQQEAQMLLDNYRRTQEPQGLMNFQNQTKERSPVRKDW